MVTLPLIRSFTTWRKKKERDNKTCTDYLSNTNSVSVSIKWLIVSSEQVWFLYLFALESICDMRLVLFIECYTQLQI